MENTKTIQTYILEFEPEIQHRLLNLHQHILTVTPLGNKTAFYHKMPTYQCNEMLLQFKQSSLYLSIYVGPQVISHFKNELSLYITTKGTIQILNSEPIPLDLITKCITYMMHLGDTKDIQPWKVYDEYWPEANEILNSLMTQLTLNKQHSNTANLHNYQDFKVISWCGYENYFSICFHQGIFLTDSQNLLIPGSKGISHTLRQMHILDITELEPAVIKAYILESIASIKQYNLLNNTNYSSIKRNEYFNNFLNTNPELEDAFNALTPEVQKKYVAYINAIKLIDTKAAVLTTLTPYILSGQSLDKVCENINNDYQL